MNSQAQLLNLMAESGGRPSDSGVRAGVMTAANAMLQFAKASDTTTDSLEYVMSNFLANMIHLSEATGLDFYVLLDKAQKYAEADKEFEQEV
jgi:hypothetical protein